MAEEKFAINTDLVDFHPTGYMTDSDDSSSDTSDSLVEPYDPYEIFASDEMITFASENGDEEDSPAVVPSTPDPKLSLSAWFARHCLMSVNIFTTIPSYFSPAEVGEMFATALGIPQLKATFAKIFGISGVGGNVFLRNVSAYHFFESYRKGILKQDRVLIFEAISTAISDAAMATLLSDTVYEALMKGEIYFDFIGAMVANFPVNYNSLDGLYAHLCRDADTIKYYNQIDAFAYHLLGRTEEETLDILGKFYPEGNLPSEFSPKQKIKFILNAINELNKPELYKRVENYCNNHNLWDGQSVAYKRVTGAISTTAIVAAASLFANNFKLYHSDLYLPIYIAAIAATVPLWAKGALYDRSWDSFFRHLRHGPDAFRNAMFLAPKDHRYLAFLIVMTALGVYMILSGTGFYLVGKGMLEFIFHKFLGNFWGVDLSSTGEPLSEVMGSTAWVYKSLVTLVGMMTNENAYMSAFSLFAGWLQNSLFKDENEAHAFFAKEAQELLNQNRPKQTVAEWAADTRVGKAVCTATATVASVGYTAASTAGSAGYTAASTAGSWIRWAASSCLPSTSEDLPFYRNPRPYSGGSSCSFFSPSPSYRNTSLISRILPPGLGL